MLLEMLVVFRSVCSGRNFSSLALIAARWTHLSAAPAPRHTRPLRRAIITWLATYTWGVIFSPLALQLDLYSLAHHLCKM